MGRKRKKKTTKKDTLKQEEKKSKQDKEEKQPEPTLSSEAKQGIAAIFLFAIALVVILSMFNLASELGNYFNEIVAFAFGKGGFMFPIIIIALGIMLLLPSRFSIRWLHYIGIILFGLSFFALLHLFVPIEDSLKVFDQARGGGIIGIAFSYPLLKAMGFWASLVVIIALLIISLIIIFNTSILAVFKREGFIRKLLNNISGFFVNLKNKIIWRKYNKEFIDKKEEDHNIEEAGFTSKEIENSEDQINNKEDNKEIENIEDEDQLSLGFIKKRSGPRIFPPLDLLESKNDKPSAGDIESNKEKIKKTLEDFGIDVEMGDVNIGPTVTQYTLKPADGVKLTSITTLSNDLSLSLAAHPIRIEAPIPGKSLVGIEVPNKAIARVGLKEALGSDEFKKRSDKGTLNIILGRDVAGNYVYASLDKMPHLLIAGATGSGKSVCINSIITSLLYQNGPDDLKFILIDPKRVELTNYNGIPHLLTPVIHNVEKTLNSFRWLIAEMDRRFDLFSKAQKKDIHTYNNSVKQEDRVPFVVALVDELADLMATAPRDMEALIVRLAQMSRAVGIHLILATQRPSVEIITGLIKANITARIAFSVASIIDSRTILDYSGAEKLLGKGDSLYISASLSKPKRIQGALLTDKEIERVTKYLKVKGGKPDYDKEIVEKQKNVVGGLPSDDEMEEDEELLNDAKQVILQADKASASLLQRRLRIGYARAARILDILEEANFVGPANGAKPREVLADDDTYISEEVDFEADEEQQSDDSTEDVDEDNQTEKNEEANGKI